MITFILAQLASARNAQPVLFFATFCFLGLTVVFAALIHLFRPIGKRPLQDGRRPRLPPGPPGLPLLGNLKDMIGSRKDPEHKWLANLPSTYGPLATLHLGQKTVILLNTHETTAHFMNKLGSATATRSPMPISSAVVSRSGRSLVLPYHEWAPRRRVMHPLLSGTSVQQYGEWQEQESTQMLAEYVLKPSSWYRHHYRYANSVVHRIALGDRMAKSTAELQDLQNAVTFFVGSIGASLIDWFPDLASSYVPELLQRLLWRRSWDALGQWNYDLYRKWWDPVKRQVDEGTAPPSFARDVLLDKGEKGWKGDDEGAMYVAMQLIEAGSDTTREALNILVMAALEHRDVFEKARREVDRVCGAGENARLPVMDDMEDLRYICAMAKEVLRWRPIFFVTPEHTSDRDIEYEGYLFPKGTSFMINEVAVGNECEDPERFWPERWMTGDEEGHEMDITHGLWQFGGGRRVCVGYRLAQRSLFITIARLVQCIDYEAYGPYNPKHLHLESTDEPFPVKATARSEHYKNLILTAAEEAEVLEDARLMRD